MPDTDLVKTGITGLDAVLSDGIPRGNVILVEGAIGTGKTTLGVEFVYRGATVFDEPGIIVLFEVSPEKLIRDAGHFGWDLPALEVYRRVQAPRTRDRAAAFDLTTRVSTGIPGLDEVVNGGYFLGSTTVVAGISGVGKSVMALQFVAEGARRGERTLMFSLDEQVAQIVRNATTIGIDLQAEIDRGVVQVHYDPPQEIEIDRHFSRIERIVQEFQPTRVVFDSISTYGSSLGTRGRVFRDFFHALVALMKEEQTATVYNHENPEMLGMSSMMGDFAMSSLVDNIVLMNWIEIGDAFRLGLTVAKMRANPTTRVTYECEIRAGEGMRVLPRRLPPAVTHPFSRYQGLISRAPLRYTDPGAPEEAE